MNLFKIIESYKVSCLLMAGVELGLFVRMEPPATLDELCEGFHGPSLERLLSAFITIGVVVKEDGRYGLSHSGKKLGEDGTLNALALISLHQYLPAWSQLAQTIRTGEPAMRNIWGEDVWNRRSQGGDEGRQFVDLMERIQINLAPQVVSAYDFSSYARVADIGGGTGHMIKTIVERWPGIKGIVFDLPRVVAAAAERLAPVKNRCECIGGSFFESVPEADLYILQSILHDWNDERCLRILRNIRDAAAEDAKLLIIEGHKKNPIMDLHMLLINDGKERSARELHGLVKQAGCRSTRQINAVMTEVVL